MTTIFFAILSCAFVVIVGCALCLNCVEDARTEATRDAVDSADGVRIDHAFRTKRRMILLGTVWLMVSVALGVFLSILDWAPVWCPVFYLPFMWGVWTTEFRHHFNRLKGREGYLGVDSVYDLWWLRRTNAHVHPKSSDHFRWFKEVGDYQDAVIEAERKATRFELGVTITSCVLMVAAIIIHQFI